MDVLIYNLVVVIKPTIERWGGGHLTPWHSGWGVE